MASVTLFGSLTQFSGGVASIDVPAANVRQLLASLCERFPELAPHLARGVAVAIDGEIFQDALLQPIGPDAEVHILPQIAGG
jgi:molybdopterin converting factor small subunit